MKTAVLLCAALAVPSGAFLAPRARAGVSWKSRASRSGVSMSSTAEQTAVAILGASGYTGAELVRLLVPHPHVKIQAMTANSQAGQSMGDVFPQFAFMKDLPTLCKHEELTEEDWKAIDMVFCCLPHATTQEIIKTLPEHVRVVDLSADFRLSDVGVYEEWYGEHKAVELQKEAVYGLTEFAREEVGTARLVANPGCYPTAAQLATVPLLEEGLISPEDIIIDAKSGATGAGRAPKQGTLFCEITEGIHAYGVAAHRHAPEIEQGLRAASGKDDLVVNFTPHLMPMARGILESIYVKVSGSAKESGADAASVLREALEQRYADEAFVHVLPEGSSPQTRHVRGSNHCLISVFNDRVPGRAIIVSVIDNVVKGASGQAIQNMNVMCGYPEETGLTNLPMFP